jgi:ABC-type molybdenum transport system ATPase subunit/photorepair protein PhrA
MKKSKVTKAARAKKKAVAVSEVYRTRKGKMLVGRIEDALEPGRHAWIISDAGKTL